MYFFKPVCENDEVKKQYDKNMTFSYEGYDDEVLSGGCSCTIKGNYVIVDKIVYPQDKPDFCEGLIRASLNFAANRGVYMAQCSCENAEYILNLMGFEKLDNSTYQGDIPSLLTGTCSGCKHNESH
ncbi:MAG: hypothetical protein IIX39_03655 [Clostridia bacterium]|nr:hypothetical protein [Clostridia bacterium]